MSEDETIHFWDERDEMSPCGMLTAVTTARYGVSWPDVTCGACRLEHPQSEGMSEETETHYGTDALLPICDTQAPGNTLMTFHWPEVTCGACRLEQPQTPGPGVREYRVPAHVLAEDVRQAQLSRVQSVIDEVGAEIERLSELLAEAVMLKDRLSGTLTDEPSEGQGEGTVYPFRRSRGISEALTADGGVMRPLSAQDFADGLAGFVKEQRRQEPLSKPGPY